jgi:hypothetical protein
METVATTISDAQAGPIGWSHSRDDIVSAVEAVFSAIKDRDTEQADLMTDLWDWTERLAALAGEAYESPIELGVAGALAPFAALAAGYVEAQDEIKRKRASIAFAEGLVMGVMAETSENVRDYFWEERPDASYQDFAEAGQLAQYYYNGGLALGYAQGKEVFAKGLASGFWADARKYVNGPLGDPDENWGRNDWIDYYIAAAGAFFKGHVTD